MGQPRKIKLEEVVGVVKDVLSVDGEVSPDVGLGRFGIEPVYLLQILQKIGIKNYGKYVSGGELNDNGRLLLDELADSYAANSSRNRHFKKLAESKNVEELASRITSRDIFKILRY